MLIIWEIYTKATIYSLFILFVIWTKPNINIHISFEDEALNRIACIYVKNVHDNGSLVLKLQEWKHNVCF